MKKSDGVRREIANRAKVVGEAMFLANLLALQASVDAAGTEERAFDALPVAEEVRALAREAQTAHRIY